MSCFCTKFKIKLTCKESYKISDLMTRGKIVLQFLTIILWPCQYPSIAQPLLSSLTFPVTIDRVGSKRVKLAKFRMFKTVMRLYFVLNTAGITRKTHENSL